MKDFIISGKNGKVYAEVDLHEHKTIKYSYTGLIVKNNFPDVITQLIIEHDELICGFSMILLDDVEERLYEFDLRLKILGKKIFSPSFKQGNLIEFFTKYPTSKGFIDDYPS